MVRKYIENILSQIFTDGYKRNYKENGVVEVNYINVRKSQSYVKIRISKSTILSKSH